MFFALIYNIALIRIKYYFWDVYKYLLVTPKSPDRYLSCNLNIQMFGKDLIKLLIKELSYVWVDKLLIFPSQKNNWTDETDHPTLVPIITYLHAKHNWYLIYLIYISWIQENIFYPRFFVYFEYLRPIGPLFLFFSWQSKHINNYLTDY